MTSKALLESMAKAYGYPGIALTEDRLKAALNAAREAGFVMVDIKRLEHIRAMCGTPDAVEGCRNILSEIQSLLSPSGDGNENP